MKILYGIQGTGHGHMSRAREIVPILQHYAELDLLVSGQGCQLSLPGLSMERRTGLTFVYDRAGSISIWESARTLHPARFFQDVWALAVQPYDLVISDFEPITAWAARRANVPSLALGHQASFASRHTPRPAQRSPFSEAILRYFAPCRTYCGFHFERYDAFIHPPVIRAAVRALMPQSGDHVTVYLAAFHHDRLIPLFQQLPEARWHVFSPHCETPTWHQNVWLHPIDNEAFLESMKGCLGVLTGAGFETCAESLFLGKKLLVVPIAGQYEQACNAAALARLGVPSLRFLNAAALPHLRSWLTAPQQASLPEVADVEQLIPTLLGTPAKPILTRAVRRAA